MLFAIALSLSGPDHMIFSVINNHNIFGFGGLGVSAFQLAKAFGAREIYAVDIDPTKLQLAKKMGAPIKRFIASSNLNDVIPRYLESAIYDPKPTIATFSNAMDVGNPSNFPRMLELYDMDFDRLSEDVQGDRLDDLNTLETIKACWEQNEYLLDPHGAIGYELLKRHKEEEETGIFLETAHPCKFEPVISKVIPDYQLPSFTQGLMKKEKQAIELANDYQKFREFLLE